jgi:hypothetical protein
MAITVRLECLAIDLSFTIDIFAQIPVDFAPVVPIRLPILFYPHKLVIDQCVILHKVDSLS